MLAVGDAGNMQNVFESNAAFGNREIRSLDKTSDCCEKLSETGNGASSSSSSTVFRASALAGVFNSLFVRKNARSEDRQILIEKDRQPETREPTNKSVAKYVMKRFVGKRAKPNKNDQKRRGKASTSSRSLQLLSENSNTRSVLKKKEEEKSSSSNGQKKSPACLAFLESDKFHTEDRIMHGMNFPRNTIGIERKRFAEPLIGFANASAPRHLSSRSTHTTEDDAVMHLFNFQKKPILNENEQNKSARPTTRDVNVADLCHLFSCNTLPSENNRKHLMYFPKIPKPHKNDKNKRAETITSELKAAVTKNLSKRTYDLSGKDRNPSNRPTALKIDENVTKGVSITNKLPDDNFMNSEGTKPDQVKLMFRNHFVEDLKTPDSLRISNGDCIKVFF